DSAGLTVGYAYDLANNLTAITYPGGQTVTHQYDAAGRLTRVTDWLGHATTFSYDADGNLLSQTVPSSPAVTDTFTYNAADQLTGIAFGRGGPSFAGFTYTRDPN